MEPEGDKEEQEEQGQEEEQDDEGFEVGGRGRRGRAGELVGQDEAVQMDQGQGEVNGFCTWLGIRA